MQQVGTRSMLATAVPVDPRHLPVPLPSPGRRVLVAASHAWVLHRGRLLRVALAGLLVAGLAGAVAARHEIAEAGAAALELAEARAADFGFAVKAISISGQALTSESAILAALAISPHQSIFDFDADAARARIAALPAIASVTVRKDYPDHVVVKVTEKVPVARWRVDGVTFVVDKDGNQISNADHAFANLPLVIGDGAAANARPMILMLDRYPTLKTGLAALSRIGDRRWDMIYENGVRIELPETGIDQALNQLLTLEAKYALLERDITLVDLRVPGLVAITPTAEAVEEIKALEKAASSHKKRNVDAEYLTPAERRSN